MFYFCQAVFESGEIAEFYSHSIGRALRKVFYLISDGQDFSGNVEVKIFEIGPERKMFCYSSKYLASL
jgi:hypothetical protein